ncbi:cystathionine beta-lyase [Tepidicaulis sp. LMO-SS28]|uniref:cystathionine beta-lyase n=1 Tax=Tepidicaulis sp. LMO-SS28 TaxID=3447455 RepID=UPI003EDF4EB8
MTKGAKKPETRLVTAGRKPEENHGIINPPVYHASTILHPTMKVLKEASQPYTYGRRLTPTIAALQDAVCDLEGGFGTVITPSGLSAVTTALLAHLKTGDHVLVTDSVYGPSRSFCEQMLTKLGIEVEFYDPLIGGGISELMKDNTRVVFTESPGSQTFEVQDIPAIAEAAHERGAIVMLDNTWATPLFFDAFEHGADISIQAATKYIVGHSDVMMGTITCNERTWKTTLRHHGLLGVTTGPDDMYLALRGLRTMGVRLKQHMETGINLARWFAARPEVKYILHPALDTDEGHPIWKRDFKGASGLFGVVLHPVSDKALAAMLDGLELFGMGFSWGGYESLIVPAEPHRTATTWREEGKLLRVHAGLENMDDLIADLEAGFDRLNKET